ncbi:hypothetical protein [Modestobacter sp. Leaf380]|uniref:hypothetical protein n=1 Tax=Modestobacter sp. Leaf380 TaxID=1736356 RepID=UPI001F3C16C9|nr:hypothetical protein [Modestobacter sp. Leaf380]
MVNLLPFPPPPMLVQGSLELLWDISRRDPRHPATADALAGLERPWEPAACTSELGAAVWSWCDDVIAWVNHEFAWRPAHMVPACWRQHPHIAREVPVLAVLRWQAEIAPGPELVEEWHRYALPTFSDRMADRLGESTCRTGRHQDWPAQSRYASFVEDLAR